MIPIIDKIKPVIDTRRNAMLYPIIFIAGLISGAIVMIVFTAAKLDDFEMKNMEKSGPNQDWYNN